jgi:glycosyltransferase involved in cell wall biosynthesis
MNPELSIIMPAIRPQNWDRVYNSILKSTKRAFELIIVSPYPLTHYLMDKANVKYVKDYGSPTRATCIGSLLCEGKFVFPTMADDAVFIEDAIDKNLDFLLSFGEHEMKNVVVAKYSESQGFTNKERYQDDAYYRLVNAYPVNREYIPADWWIFNTVFFHRNYFEYLGGYDSRFEAACMAHADLAIRAQKEGAIVKMSEFPILQCDHIPSGGDHTPIEIAQVQYDTPAFIKKHNIPLSNKEAVFIHHNNWKGAERIWSKRFKI